MIHGAQTSGDSATLRENPCSPVTRPGRPCCFVYDEEQRRILASASKHHLVFELKITLLETKPPVWRRFCVPGEITLDRLHDVIQIVMGWDDCHLHLFKIGGKAYSEEPEEEWEGAEERHHGLCDLVTSARKHFDYKYDFGDDWDHRIVVEKISKAPKGYIAEAKCLGGKRRCPPEDVGGTHGFAEFVLACKDLKHPEHKRNLMWVGGSFDPDDFNPNAVNLELRKYKRWSRPRADGAG